ncbi:MAG: aspartate aminotransferase family protein [Planctomycetota bacterium]
MTVAPIDRAAAWVATETDHGAGCVRPRPLAFVDGEGARLYTESGEEYLDASASYGVASLGHAHPRVTAAIADQARRLVALTPSYANDARARYLDALTAVLPAPLDRAFLCNSGTEAVEAGLKISRLATERHGVVACARGFHGRTMGALSATAERAHRAPFTPLLQGVGHVRYGDAAALDEAITEETGAVVLEVIQGEGGVRPAPDGYLAEARRLCDERGALLVFDEVQTGFGRTGTLFACEREGVVPDVLCLGKGIAGGVAMGAAAFGPRVGALPPGSHGSTFGGNPLACAAAHATLETLLDHDIPRRAAALGEHAQERLAPLVGGAAREVRGRGLMVGIELRTKVAPVLAALLERRVVALSAGRNVLRLLPPLVIEEDEWDAVLDRVLEVLS